MKCFDLLWIYVSLFDHIWPFWTLLTIFGIEPLTLFPRTIFGLNLTPKQSSNSVLFHFPILLLYLSTFLGDCLFCILSEYEKDNFKESEPEEKKRRRLIVFVGLKIFEPTISHNSNTCYIFGLFLYQNTRKTWQVFEMGWRFDRTLDDICSRIWIFWKYSKYVQQQLVISRTYGDPQN